MYHVIVIERQYASGGNEIGRKLAKELGYKLYDRNLLAEAAKQGGCVIVGRAAGYILKERTDCLNVFIHCDRERRIARAIAREGIKASEAEDVLKKNDKRRSGFYNSVTNWEWGNPKFFELCLDSGKLGIDLCVELLLEAAKKN